MLTSLTPLLDAARRGGYAIGTLTVFNMETARGVIDAVVAAATPTAISITRRMTPYLDLEGLAAYVTDRAAGVDLPLALHLDHGTDLGLVERCLRAGFSSVQYDGANLAYADKVSTTRDAVAMAREFGASVEAELDHIGRQGYEAGGALTEPAEAADFALATGVDILAVSVGSNHGQARGEALLDFPRIRAIRAATDVHLALHGGSGVDPAQLVESIDAGITKISYFHGMAERAMRRLLDDLPTTPHGMIATLLDESLRQAYGEQASRMLPVFGGPGRAPSASAVAD